MILLTPVTRAAAQAILAGLLGLSMLPAGGQKPSDSSEKEDKKAAAGDVLAGKKLYRTHCATCHFADATIDKVGPGMKGLFQLKKLPRRGLPATEENVRKIILEGVGDPKMPLMPLYRDLMTPKEIDDLMAYLKTL